jgi:hypothetical protein
MIRMLSLLMLVFVAAVAPAAASAIDEHVKPWDEGPQDPSFLKFRNQLKDVIARKDAAALIKLLAPEIKLDFGGGNGIAAFQKQWSPSDPKSELWSALSLVVDQGGNFDSKTVFSAPYTFSAFPSDLDGADKAVVTSPGAAMRVVAKSNAPVLRQLDHDILTVNGTLKPQHEAGADDWAEATDGKGTHGFVLARDVRSPLDYRALFEKRKGKWLLTAFVASD